MNIDWQFQKITMNISQTKIIISSQSPVNKRPPRSSLRIWSLGPDRQLVQSTDVPEMREFLITQKKDLQQIGFRLEERGGIYTMAYEKEITERVLLNVIDMLYQCEVITLSEKNHFELQSDLLLDDEEIIMINSQKGYF